MTKEYEVKLSKFNVLLNLSTATFFGLMYLTVVVTSIIGESYWFILFCTIFFGFFVGGNIYLHLNYWKFDNETVLSTSEDEFVIRNKRTGKEFKLKTSEFAKSSSVYSTGRVWDYGYTRFKLVDGRVFTLSDYLIDTVELFEINSVSKIMKGREIRRTPIPSIDRLGKIDMELRTS